MVQKLLAHGAGNPVSGLIAAWPLASPSTTLPPELISWYCFRLPYQRGWILTSGRNIGTKTWFWSCARLVALTGRLAEANVEFTALICSRILTSAL